MVTWKALFLLLFSLGSEGRKGACGIIALKLMQPRMVVPAWDPSGGRDRRFASSWLAWATGDPASKQQNILAFRYNAAMEPAVCTYLEVISFHLTKQPLLVTIMSHSGYWSQGFPFSTWLVRVGPGASPAGSHHFLCSFFNHAALFFSQVVLPERSALQNEPNPSSFLFTSAGFDAVWSRIRRGKACYISVSIWSHIFTLPFQIPLYLHIATWFPVCGDPSPQTPHLSVTHLALPAGS